MSENDGSGTADGPVGDGATSDESDVDRRDDGAKRRPDAEPEGAPSAADPAPSTESTVVSGDVAPEDLTIEPQSLHPRVRIVWILQSLLSAAFLGGLAGAADRYVLEIGLWIAPAVFAVFAAIGVVHALLRYRVWEYEVREDALYLERGVVTRVRTVVPYVRIQHVDASRGAIERAVGLASAVVYTAGTRGADVTIPGLTAEQADDLQQRLKQLAIIAEGDDAV